MFHATAIKRQKRPLKRQVINHRLVLLFVKCERRTNADWCRGFSSNINTHSFHIYVSLVLMHYVLIYKNTIYQICSYIIWYFNIIFMNVLKLFVIYSCSYTRITRSWNWLTISKHIRYFISFIPLENFFLINLIKIILT